MNDTLDGCSTVDEWMDGIGYHQVGWGGGEQLQLYQKSISETLPFMTYQICEGKSWFHSIFGSTSLLSKDNLQIEHQELVLR